MDKKPNVFPTQGQNQTNTETVLNTEKPIQVQVNDPIAESAQPTNGEQSAAEEMRRRTAEELRLKNHAVERTQQSASDGAKAREELMAEMAKTSPEPQGTPQQTQEIQEGAMSYEDMVKFQTYTEGMNKKQTERPPVEGPSNQQPPVPVPPVLPPAPPLPPSSYGQPSRMVPSEPNDVYIQQLSQPQTNSPFDVIPLPSEGKLYNGIGRNIKVAFMSTADENILTSPNLLTSGKFLEILINRKILNPNLRYRDLVEGDRNAIMLWLRATGFGHMYPITVNDEAGVPFETEVNLNDIKTINLSKEPDTNGHFEFTLPLSGLVLKYKLLTIGESEDIAEIVEYEMETLKLPIDNTSTYTLAKQIVSINGDTNQEAIKALSESMRLMDGEDLKKEIESIDCGVDMTISVETPRGGSMSTFLPLNLKFFWPNFGV